MIFFLTKLLQEVSLMAEMCNLGWEKTAAYERKAISFLFY